ncbi:Band 7 protein [Planktothrix serta PCC 8927]|uniref:Band 7 protein n=1 Tax=Planktothrix serta PCC 8927 TaxID=671068 RepID=A0A7Z9C4L1_9CYAN|nr:SPFH domain-containing protein [Planktothrix serta]VXD25436.1 Band 7 protein [Planktothrix serta PCC 8927]
MFQYLLGILFPIIIGFTLNSSVKVISTSDQAIVEQLGKYKRTLKPGLQFIVPVVEKIVYYDTNRERLLDIDPQEVITKDQITLKINAVVFWKIEDLQNFYYNVETDKTKEAISNLVLTTLRAEIGLMNLEDLLAKIKQLNTGLLGALAQGTKTWGIKIIRVDIQNITPPKSIQDAMERKRVAESRKQAEILEAQGQAQSIKVLADTLGLKTNSSEFLKFLITKQYVDANQQLSSSANAKVIFMNPNQLTEPITHLMDNESENTNPSIILPDLQQVPKPQSNPNTQKT